MPSKREIGWECEKNGRKGHVMVAVLELATATVDMELALGDVKDFQI
jgi:hypothetical protein